MNGPLIRNVSDTALWIAAYRAWESERKDAHFHDPFARRLAGERGEKIARKNDAYWPMVARTWLIDKLVTEQVQQGTDTIINLAAGLDTRPYRMKLPESLNWIEVDLPDILTYKEEILATEKPVCQLERISLDLSNVSARRILFEQVNAKAVKALVIAEGLVIYLSAHEVNELAKDLAIQNTFRHWIIDLASPGLLKMLQKNFGDTLNNAPMKFAPVEGPDYFRPLGWRPVEIHSMLKTAAHLNRLPFFLRLFSFLPESKSVQGSRPWSAICMFEK